MLLEEMKRVTSPSCVLYTSLVCTVQKATGKAAWSTSHENDVFKYNENLEVRRLPWCNSMKESKEQKMIINSILRAGTPSRTGIYLNQGNEKLNEKKNGGVHHTAIFNLPPTRAPKTLPRKSDYGETVKGPAQQ